MIRTPKQAVAVANATHSNVEGMCQQVTRGYFNAPSAGDRDGDGDADAYDGWLSEPKAARHAFDRNPPAGYPVSFKNRHGHRAISLGAGVIRSTDFNGVTKRYQAGVVGNGTIAELERAMGIEYLGWSETIDGQPIPKDAPEKPTPKPPPAKPKEDPRITRLRNEWVNHRRVDRAALSALQQAGVKDWAKAADVAGDAIDKAMRDLLAHG